MPNPFSPFDPNDPTGGMSAYGGSPWSGVFDALTGAGLGLMQASSPSAAPKDFGSLFGGLAGGAAMGMQNGEDRRLKRMLVGSQVALSQQKVKQLTEWQKLLSGGGTEEAAGPQTAGTGAPTPLHADAGGDMAPFRAAVKGNESRGQPNGGYGAVGPIANSQGQRAYGAYQVMDFNIGPWTQEVLGKAMTPQEFLANPQAQDAVFDAKFGQAMKQYGNPQDAASVWFSGKPLAGNKSGPDVLGTTVPGYVAKFNQGLPPGAQMAQMPGPPQGLTPQGPPPAQMPGAPAGLVPPGPPMAPMPQVGGPPAPLNPMGPIAGGPQVAQGDGSGNPVQQAQYTPQAAPAAPQAPPQQAPRSLSSVVKSLSPGERQIIVAMGPEKGMEYLLKNHVSPDLVPAFDPRTGQLAFATKAQIQSGQLQPASAADYGLSREKFGWDQRKWTEEQKREAEKFELEKRKAAEASANRDVTLGPDGQPRVNQTVLDAKKGVSAVQGTDSEGKIKLELAQDAIKRNSDWQKSGVQSQSTIHNLDVFEKLADQVKQGRYQGSMTDFKAALKGTGINLEAWGIPDSVGPAQAMQMIGQRFALEMRQDMPGPMSDGDRKFMVAGALSIERDPGANKIMAEFLRGNAQRNVDRAKAAREYVKSDQFARNPAGIDDYVEEKLAGKDYFRHDVLPQPKAGSLPMPGKVRRFNPATGALE